jgi:membrane protease YdiL (CAAX protease family)
MAFPAVSPINLSPFILLMVTVPLLWAGRRFWIATLVLAVAAGYIVGVLTGAAGLLIAILAIACLAYDRSNNFEEPWKRRVAKAVSVIFIVVLSVGLAVHKLPGFHNLQVMSGVVFSPDSAPFNLWLNFDKATAGILLLGLTYHPQMRAEFEWIPALKRALALCLLTVVVVTGLALLAGFVRWAPKFDSQFALWASDNLLLTCMSEEAFFRGFIQHQIATALSAKPWGYIIAIIISALLFGLAHLAGGWTYAALAAVAGVGYGLTLHRTQRIEMSILTHFAVNATHFLLFTYPYWIKH